MCVLCGPDGAQSGVDHSIDHPFELKPEPDFKCSTCGEHVSVHPDKMEFLKKHEMDGIIRRGHVVRFIMDDPAFAYSIGRTVKDRPELLVTGSLHPDTLQYIINRVAELDDATPLSAGMDLDEVLEGYKVRLVRVGDLEEAQMFGVSRQFGTDDTSALQILWPDSEGRFPGEEGYEYGDAQPVFG